MSWYRDPQLFIGYYNSSDRGYIVDRIVKKCSDFPLVNGDVVYQENLDFSKHLSLGNNKESDYDTLKSSIRNAFIHINIQKFVNCQGLVVLWDWAQSRGTWAREDELSSIISCLPGIINPQKIFADNKKLSELEAENSLLKEKLNNEVTNLQQQLNKEKNAKKVLEKQVLDLTAKLVEPRVAEGGSTDLRPWLSGDTVPSHWVPFEDLDVLNFPKNNTPPAIMEGLSKPKIVEDVTTNVQVSHFYRGTFVVAVNVEELTPENEKARFDPEFWGLYTNAGVTYAARKPLKSEM